ncbi:MAG: DUF1003 domain-containing protein [Candidatus Eremiobacteraeota bacterium]|nr:DUF1003 domain-containing protein [Candidatus Eremiobacteraeota bacterium]
MASELDIPGHIQDSVDSIAELRARAHLNTTPHQRNIEWLTKRLGKPAFFFCVLAFVSLWIACNVVLRAAGRPAFDPPPFPALAGLVSLSALLMTILILTTETRLGEIADQRSRLALQIGVLTEQKVAKTIELLERQRKDDPSLRDRNDPEAQAMAEAADPKAVLEALDQAHRTMLGDE